MGKTKIEWCDTVWNPISGCTPISEGCKNCWAKRMSKRLAGRFGYPADDPFRVTLHPDKMDQPLRWRKPRQIFVCSMGDLFHDAVPGRWIERVWQTMFHAKIHTFIVLTKRPERMLDLVTTFRDVSKNKAILPNVWLGITAENQKQADKRIPILLQIPAAVHFVSIEPMLGSIDLHLMSQSGYRMLSRWYGQDGFDKTGSQPELEQPRPGWIIVGGETGPGARPTNPEWVRSIRNQCQSADVPFFFKSWGDWLPYDYDPESPIFGIPPDYYTDPDAGYSWTKVGKKRAGRSLDGREWDEYPRGHDDD